MGYLLWNNLINIEEDNFFLNSNRDITDTISEDANS